jgi:trimethylamine corrinoid protein
LNYFDIIIMICIYKYDVEDVNTMSLREDFVMSISNLEEDESNALAGQLLKNGCSFMELLELLQLAVKMIGIRYEDGEYFIADLIMSGIVIRNALDVYAKTGDASAAPVPDARNCVLIGTAEGDIHDIGKDIMLSILEAQGLSVIDLGVDVSPDSFVQAIEKYHPRVVVMSGIMTFASKSMVKTISAISGAGLRDQVKIIVGGGCVNQQAAEAMGADAYSEDVVSGSQICRKWVEEEN